MAAAVGRIDAWVERERSPEGTFGLVAAERQDVTDRTASHRWYLRFKGEEKDFITVWLTLRQRTLHHEAQFMPAPEEHVAEVLPVPDAPQRRPLRHGLLPRAPKTPSTWSGRVPAALVDDDELDRIAGSSIVYVDDHFPTAMTLGLSRPCTAAAPTLSRPARPGASPAGPVASRPWPCKLLVVGGGKMGGALVTGLLDPAAGPRRGRWPWSSRSGRARGPPWPPSTRAWWCSTAPEAELGGRADGGAVLAVKPDVAESRLPGARGGRRDPGALDRRRPAPASGSRRAFPTGRSVVRAMPNTPALVGAGVTAISGGSHGHGGRPGLGRGDPLGRRARWSGCPNATSTP